MRLKTYLLTEGRTKEITKKQFLNNVKKKCSQIVATYKSNKWNNLYYRGINTPIESSDIKAAYGFVQPSNFTRESAWATYNTYTLLIDNLSSWNKFPKRSKSIVMTTDFFNARRRGGFNIAYAVFPINGSRIAICPRHDIWESFPKLMARFGLTNMENFNNYFMRELNIKIGKDQYDIDEWDDLKKLFNTIIPDPDTEEGHRVWQTISKFDLEPFIGKKLGDAVIPYLDPKKNGFKLFTPQNKLPNGDKECWTDGDSYLIDTENLREVIEDL